jgi:hypothetical protein
VNLGVFTKESDTTYGMNYTLMANWLMMSDWIDGKALFGRPVIAGVINFFKLRE